MHERAEEHANEELREVVERQRATIDRLERKVNALADAVGVRFAGQCSYCEDGLLMWSDGALVCSTCEYVEQM